MAGHADDASRSYQKKLPAKLVTAGINSHAGPDFLAALANALMPPVQNLTVVPLQPEKILLVQVEEKTWPVPIMAAQGVVVSNKFTGRVLFGPDEAEANEERKEETMTAELSFFRDFKICKDVFAEGGEKWLWIWFRIRPHFPDQAYKRVATWKEVYERAGDEPVDLGSEIIVQDVRHGEDD